mmetsp:Transcript_51387/g.158411  ORF Transcript_51387/g.158411 Transcript_51387/m.158411 type:complete len:261 (+) Transcript_51387:223-1005(+)
MRLRPPAPPRRPRRPRVAGARQAGVGARRRRGLAGAVRGRGGQGGRHGGPHAAPDARLQRDGFPPPAAGTRQLRPVPEPPAAPALRRDPRHRRADGRDHWGPDPRAPYLRRRSFVRAQPERRRRADQRLHRRVRSGAPPAVQRAAGDGARRGRVLPDRPAWPPDDDARGVDGHPRGPAADAHRCLQHRRRRRVPDARHDTRTHRPRRRPCRIHRRRPEGESARRHSGIEEITRRMVYGAWADDESHGPYRMLRPSVPSSL